MRLESHWESVMTPVGGVLLKGYPRHMRSPSVC